MTFLRFVFRCWFMHIPTYIAIKWKRKVSLHNFVLFNNFFHWKWEVNKTVYLQYNTSSHLKLPQEWDSPGFLMGGHVHNNPENPENNFTSFQPPDPEGSRSLSEHCFIALIWAIVLVRLWMSFWIIQLLPILFAVFIVKKLGQFLLLFIFIYYSFFGFEQKKVYINYQFEFSFGKQYMFVYMTHHTVNFSIK